MNELKLDYTKKGRYSLKSKRLLMIGGVAMITLSLATLALVVVNDFKALLIVPAIANTLVGVHFILSSVEHKLLFPKKYFHISEKAIEFKLGGFYKEQSIGWDSINRISDEGKSVHIYTSDGLVKINMLHFPSLDEKRIRSTIKALVEEKGL